MAETILSEPLQAALGAVARHAAAVDHPGATLALEIGWLQVAGALADALPEALSAKPTWADHPLRIAAVLRAVGRASLPVGRLFEGHLNAAQLVAVHGTTALRGRIAAAVVTGDLLGVWGADGDVALTAIRDDGGFMLTGAKDFCSGLGLVGTALVSAAVPGGTQLLAVDARDPARGDPARWRMAGMRATNSGGYDFTGLRVPADAALGGVDAYYAEPWFLGGMYRMCAVQVGGIEALLVALIAQLAARGQHDDPLQVHRLGQAAAQLQMARAVVEHVAGRVADTGDGDIGSAAILMREAVEGCATTVLCLVERAAGTAAHRAGSDLERLRRDLGLYLRQAIVDGRLNDAGGRIMAAPELLYR